MALFDFAEALRLEKRPGVPWFMEMTRLRRLHFLWLNKRLATIRKRILESRRASDEDMMALQTLLRDQATAVRDFQYIRSLDHLSPHLMERRRAQSAAFFTSVSSAYPDVDPFETENYRVLHPKERPSIPPDPFSDQVTHFIHAYFPWKPTWTKDERAEKLSSRVGRIVRFVIAMFGALFILVPMYIMALDQSKVKNLVVTTVAVVLFGLVCSVGLRVNIEQLLSLTAAYAAVLVVFVGLTSEPGE